MDLFPEFSTIFEKEKIEELTPIQTATVQPLLDGESVVGLAPTGTGKTLAYTLPLLKRVQQGKANSLVIFEPTTELAVQVRDAIQPYVKALELQVAALVGSGNRVRQIEVLKKKHPEVLIVTPGRFFDMVSENRIHHEQIKQLVIDEADDILESTKLELIANLGQNIPETSQIALFGATESPITHDAEQIFGREFLLIDVRDQNVSQVKHFFLQVDNRHKLDMFTKLTKVEHFSAMVFFNAVKQLEYFSGVLSHTKISFDALSNATNKQASKNALQNLEKRNIKALLTTDLAARGLDVTDLQFVVNYELPADKNTYVHRAGRTGRMGKKGTVITLGTDHDLRNLKKLLGDEYKLERVYFDGRDLTTEKPVNTVEETSNETRTETVTSKTTSSSNEKERQHEQQHANKQHTAQSNFEHEKKLERAKRKKKQKNQKNKGYHPLKEKKAKKELAQSKKAK